MFSYSTHLRVYCERTSDALFAEPVNILSNIGFFLAAAMLWRLHRRYRGQMGDTADIKALIFIVFLIGSGSVIFHSVATIGAMYFDIVPILLFIVFYLVAFSHSLLGFSRARTAFLLVTLVAINLGYKHYVFRAIDGYFSYLPTFLFLLALALYMLLSRHVSALRITFATLVAFASLLFRTMDRSWCHAIPTGTHFLWHLCNALLVYLLVRELMLYRVSHGNR